MDFTVVAVCCTSSAVAGEHGSVSFLPGKTTAHQWQWLVLAGRGQACFLSLLKTVLISHSHYKTQVLVNKIIAKLNQAFKKLRLTRIVREQLIQNILVSTHLVWSGHGEYSDYLSNLNSLWVIWMIWTVSKLSRQFTDCPASFYIVREAVVPSAQQLFSLLLTKH